MLKPCKVMFSNVKLVSACTSSPRPSPRPSATPSMSPLRMVTLSEPQTRKAFFSPSAPLKSTPSMVRFDIRLRLRLSKTAPPAEVMVSALLLPDASSV